MFHQILTNFLGNVKQYDLYHVLSLLQTVCLLQRSRVTLLYERHTRSKREPTYRQ